MMTHGTVSGYVHHKCRCDDCRQAYRRYMKRLRHEQFTGAPSRRDRLVGTQPARDHVARLMADGWSFNGITKTAGYRSRNSLRSVLDAERCRPETLARILAVQVDRRPDSYVTAEPTVRRLRDLALAGWSNEQIAHRVGMGRWTVADIRAGRRAKVRRSTALAVLRAHQQLAGQRGPSTLAAARARRAGWGKSR